jgi:glycosyltransferase involved in cell wall biosynthesis
MKITIVLGAFLPVPPTMGGAVEKIWYLLAREFAKRGHELVIVSRQMPDQPREEFENGIHHLRVPGFEAPRSLVWLKFLDFLYSLKALAVLPGADVVVTNTFWLPILLRDPSRGNIYVHVGRYPKGQMRFYRRAAKLQAPSKAVGRAIVAEAPSLSEKVSVVPYPAPSASGQPPPIGNRSNTILYVGRVHPEKGVHLLVDAFVRGTGTAFSDWKLMIVGPTETRFGGGGADYSNALRRSAAQIGDRINFGGPIFDSIALDEAFRSARLFVYPSLAERGESFGLAPLEAMSHGCAVLVSKLECFADFIREGETGFVFDHRSKNPTESLQAKLETVVRDQTMLCRVADTGRRESAEYSLARVADRFIADFSSLI